MNLEVFGNLALIALIGIGHCLGRNSSDTNNTTKHKLVLNNDKNIWKLIDISIIFISLYFIIIRKKYVYMVSLLASSYMLVKFDFTYNNNNAQFGSNEHISLLTHGHAVDGLICGIALSNLIQN